MVLGIALVAPLPASADNFRKDLARIDEVIASQPPGIPDESIESCKAMRKTAIKLYKMGMVARAERRLKSCKKMLNIRD